MFDNYVFGDGCFNSLKAWIERPFEMRVEEACAQIWQLRQEHGIENVDVEWFMAGEHPDGRVATVTVRQD